MARATRADERSCPAPSSFMAASALMWHACRVIVAEEFHIPAEWNGESRQRAAAIVEAESSGPNPMENNHP
jgi:hypothetical protein